VRKIQDLESEAWPRPCLAVSRPCQAKQKAKCSLVSSPQPCQYSHDHGTFSWCKLSVLALCFPHFIATYEHLIFTYSFPMKSSVVKTYIKALFLMHWIKLCIVLFTSYQLSFFFYFLCSLVLSLDYFWGCSPWSDMSSPLFLGVAKSPLVEVMWFLALFIMSMLIVITSRNIIYCRCFYVYSKKSGSFHTKRNRHLDPL
jgi:hypothetical protein